jgi:allophanate hydrolase
MTITALLTGYRSGAFTVAEVIDDLLARRDGTLDLNAWITPLSREQIFVYVEQLKHRSPDELPLYGVPFAIKDNIDLAGVATTAGCREYGYTPKHSATVVQRLIDAGAIPIGKTNLDQFATGLNGTRSPFGICRNPFDDDYIAGGSSSGSAVVVAQGIVAFSLGTDTAGSGRVPAAFNNLIGLKPTRGLLSTKGVVPACRTLDCVSIFALDAADAQRVFDIATSYDAAEPWSRAEGKPLLGSRTIPAQGFRFGVPYPEQLRFFGNDSYRQGFEKAQAQLRALGGTAVEIDLEPFFEAARLLYQGPWVAERYAAIQDFIQGQADKLLPVIRIIIEGANTVKGVDTFNGIYRLAELRRTSEHVWGEVDLIVTPTTGTHFRIGELLAEPILRNSELGYYTNFMNLLDLSAVAVPSGFQQNGLPFGITLFAPAFNDRSLLILAARLHHHAATGMGLDVEAAVTAPLPAHKGEGTLHLAVCGAHMSGLPLNHQLTSRGAHLVARTATSPHYRFYRLAGGPPYRPGLVRVAENGAAIALEVWALPTEQFGAFIHDVPSPLTIGRVQLADGSTVAGFLCESVVVNGAEEITHFGGWRGYLASL